MKIWCLMVEKGFLFFVCFYILVKLTYHGLRINSDFLSGDRIELLGGIDKVSIYIGFGSWTTVSHTSLMIIFHQRQMGIMSEVKEVVCEVSFLVDRGGIVFLPFMTRVGAVGSIGSLNGCGQRRSIDLFLFVKIFW